jgi:hypothetical protein
MIGEACAGARHYRAHSSTVTLCGAEWIEWRVYLHHRALAQIKHHMDNLLCPQRIINPPKMDDTTRADAFARPIQSHPIKTALDWQAWNKTTGDRADQRSPGGSQHRAAKRWSVQQRPLPQFDAGTMCPSM